ncbi:hypothetical protein [Serratia sp. UGAL515B_01]|uniref:hypothetical protein n=1 Tax=Serratia sp. UGAL515B_01 TaxID=2986763 RepID=UPI002954F57D|nr:hypothetical protein [Serratia sp. UGAL515B_01]WON77804.1 hypothetical protein OK023_03710 [Serratia sp. UGAL515B_01]
MRDIYSVLVSNDFSKISDDSLEEYKCICGDTSLGINNAMRVIGNLLLEIEGSEEYSNEDARRDLSLVGGVLRHLPRLSEVLDQNSRSAEFELKMRRMGGG